jgi:ubiquitin-protein ligase E3 C
MYQSFTGQSRRPRQVNLSGRPSNPFAAASQNAGPQSTIASAQHERLQRQLQRERIQASGRIQRVWRGHRARRRAFQSWREIWDAAEEQPCSDGVYASAEESLSQLNRLLLFYSPNKEPSDIKRLGWYGMKQIATLEKTTCAEGRWPQAYAKLRQACLVALKASGHSEDPELYRTVLNVLAFAANPLKRSTEMDKADALAYYETLTSLNDAPEDALQNALIAPLGTEGGYAGIAILLGHPLSSQMLSLLKSAVYRPSLIHALSETQDLEWSARSRLWLLGNINFLCGSTRIGTTTAIARLLGSLADEVDFEGAPLDMNNVLFDREVLAKTATDLPLNTYLYEQTSSLVNQESVRNLLVRNSRADENHKNSGTTNAQLYANYALTLLRCFPRKADDIRMWLYLGPTQPHDIPATRFFWNAAKQSSVFATVSKDSRAVVPLLRSTNAAAQKDDWTVILVFLELYTFLLKIMDDEEFMGKTTGGPQSAIPIEDVAILVTFLKNLGFALYFNAAELNEHSTQSSRDTGSLSLHFGGNVDTEPADEVEAKPLTLAGMPGMTADYLKGIATALLRSIYERDSRRHFLPINHWLMTSRFDMTAFIPGVVAEEENRHRLAEQEEDEDKGDEDSDDDVFGISLRGPTRNHRSQEARARAQRKAARRRYLESVAPRLEILQNMPFFIPFHTRVEIFRHFVHLDQAKRRNGLVDPDTWRANMMFAHQNPGGNMLARHHAQIKRKSEFEDAFQAFYDLGTDLKEPIQITFLDEFGLQEAGIDGGGVTKEFLTSVINQAFDPANVGLDKYFVENEKHLLFPNPTALDDARVNLEGFGLDAREVHKQLRDTLRRFEFLGRIIGKCLYEEILVDVSFAGFFLKKWALTGGHGSAPGESGYRANINDLRDFDEALYKGLLDVKKAADASEYGLTFTIDDRVGPPNRQQVIERELIPNGANTPVTNENRLIYLNRMSWYRLQGQSAPQTNAFLKGLSSIIQPSWLSMFNQAELQTLIGGAQVGIDVSDLRRNTQYGGVYVIGDDGLEHPSVRHFWKVMESLPDEDRRKVLKFVTSTPRGPLLGFANLNPRFSIRDSSSDEGRIPTASTCVNLLKLPMYKSEKVLRDKLLYAVNSGAGFDLS